MIDNQRVAFLTKIAEKYIEYYRIFNKEENITIISSQALTEEERYEICFKNKEDKWWLHLRKQVPMCSFLFNTRLIQVYWEDSKCIQVISFWTVHCYQE